MRTMYYHRRKFFYIPLIIAAIALFGWVTMTLWNLLLPEIFNLPVINFWQAAGLLVLAWLFFGSGHSKWHQNSSHMNRELRSKVKNMSPEEKREFFRKMHYHRNNWQRECCQEEEQKSKTEVKE